MAFNSITFLLFVFVVIIIYFAVPKKLQWMVLLAASFAYYLVSAGSMVVLLLFTTATTFYTGVLMGKANDRYAARITEGGTALTREQKKQLNAENKHKKWLIMLAALLANLGILAFLKYFNFFSASTNALLSRFSVAAPFPALNLLLPLGISFYTFQSLGYVIDVYRGKYPPDQNIAKFALFVSFFPQIVQGPIARYDQLAHQLFESHYLDYNRIKFGAQLVLWGLFKKMVIADRAAIIVRQVFDHSSDYSGVTIFFGVMMYMVQIYGDFSGGIDIARGVAQIMGITLANNFNRPFFATSIADFWRRWHISLSSWMRDYLFYPLSLSKTFARLGKSSRKILGNYLGKLLPTFLAMLITFMIIGIWHGASWKFVAYGLYNGSFIFAGILLEPLANRFIARFNIKIDRFGWRLSRIMVTLLLITIGRYFSRAASFMAALRMLKQTFLSFNPNALFDGTLTHLGLDWQDLNVLFIALTILLVVEILQEKGFSIRQKVSEQHLVIRWSLYLFVIFGILIFGMYGIQYKNIDFIYQGF